MNNIKLRLLLFVLLTALAVMLTGCKSESSPTAPPTTTTPGTTTNPTTPPSGANVTLSFSNQNPVAPANVTVTATATLNGQPVPNGTAVQFTTNIGTFVEAASTPTPTSVIRTTTNGIATATLSVPSAGSGTVQATVNNVTKSANITVGSTPVTPPPASTTPTITGVSPNTGLPAGGTVITITGTNFRAPVRVVVDPGAASGQAPKDAFVNSVTATQIVAVMPSFNVSTGTTLPVNITVIDESGTANQQSVTSANAFTYAAAVLTPSIRTLDPTSGPIVGGTRVAILGDAFQQPVQVFFGSAEAQVIRVNFNEIDVVSPTASQTAPGGSGVVTGPVDVKVTNVASGKSATSPQQFRYVAKMQITSVSPSFGPATGGTDLLIDGSGFDGPVTVDLGPPTPALTRAQVLSVSPTEIRARTVGLASPCAATAGNLQVTVTNVNNGDSASSGTGQTFTFVPIPALITSITSNTTPPVPGNSLTVAVQNPGVGLLDTANITFAVGTLAATATPQTITTGTGTVNFGVVIPTGLAFPTVACTNGGFTGTQLGTASFPVTFTNMTTGCTASSTVIIAPPLPNVCAVPPAAAVIAPVPPGCAAGGSSAVGTASATQPIITIANVAPASGGGTLKITGAAIAGANAADFTVAPVPTPATAVSVNPGGSANFTITFKPSATGARSANVTFTTNDPNNPTLTVCLTGTGT